MRKATATAKCPATRSREHWPCHVGPRGVARIRIRTHDGIGISRVIARIIGGVVAWGIAAVVSGIVSAIVITRGWRRRRCWRVIAAVGHRRRTCGGLCWILPSLLLTLQSVNPCKQCLLYGRGFGFLQHYFNVLCLPGAWRRDIGNIDLALLVGPLIDVTQSRRGDD